MSQPKEFKVTITVLDEQGSSLNRNFDYSLNAIDYNEQVDDLIDAFLEAENL